MRRPLVLLSLLLVTSACVRTSPPDERSGADSIYGTWELTELDADRGPSVLPASHPVTLTLTPGPASNVRGQSFINTYTGSVQLEEGRVVSVPRIALTRRAGPTPLMELEGEYLRRWQEADRVARDGASLVVLDEDGRRILRFRRPL
jgi:heat shock protein HslJ